jgi:integrase
MDRAALSPLLRSFERHLRAENRSEHTIASYLDSLRQAEDGPRRLLATCAGKSFEDRRDTVLILLLVDVGPRRAELMGLTVDDVDFDLEVLLVLGKGRRERALPFGRNGSAPATRTPGCRGCGWGGRAG